MDRFTIGGRDLAINISCNHDELIAKGNLVKTGSAGNHPGTF